jgi:D-glycero-alpha-D-manno-heptose 1-phosphate guanylyltransferase
MIDAIILCGGFGTRLKSVSNGLPKTLMPIGKKVYLDLVLGKVFDNQIANIYLSLHYRPELFQDYIDHSVYGNKLSTIIEPKPLGTGGAINYVIENSKISSPFFVINGDSFSNINLDQMFIKFDDQNLTAFLGISAVKDAKRYGTVLEKEGEVLSFNEKGVRGGGWINNGHYIFKKKAFEGSGVSFSLEKDLLPKLVKNKKLGAFKVANDNFIDIGIPEDYQKLCKIYEVLNL